ncbi:MAG TPA: hypothetical protein VN229_04270 [Terriglobales bacterium]|nr:hypothetical protein [Terriglobales bacterium]
MKFPLLLAAMAMPMLLSACATSQPLVHDDVDRLFLKYAEIAQRPSPMSADEAAESAKITDRIRSSSETCLAKKSLKLFPVSALLKPDLSGASVSAAELQSRKEEARQYLKGLQQAGTSGDGCPYSGFPPVQIN